MSDERFALRQRLEDGDWRALLDPLLPLVLLDDPGAWWTRARSACAGRVLTLLQGYPAAREARWEWVCVRLTLDRDDAWITPRVQRIVIGWATERARTWQARPGAPAHPDTVALLAALDVMRQYPPGR